MASGDVPGRDLETPMPRTPPIPPTRRVIHPDPDEFFDSGPNFPQRNSTPQPSPSPQPFVKLESLSKWNLSFDGKSCVREFFLRVEEEIDARCVPYDYVVRRFHELLSDSALKYFRSLKFPGLSYDQLKGAFLRTFGEIDYDFKVERELRSLRQTATQSARDFIIAARDLNSKLRNPIHEADLFTIVKYGLHPRYHPCLATNFIIDLDALLHITSNFEAFQPQRSVCSTSFSSQNESPPHCLKCNATGHQYRACPNIPGPVCFNCKRLGVVTRNCTSCNPSGSKN